MIVYGLNPVLEALRAGRVRAIRLGTASSPRTAEVRRLATAAGTPVTRVPTEVLDRVTGGAVHQGVVADVAILAPLTLDELIAGATAPALLLVLDGIEDPQNLGAILRAAEAAAVDGVIRQTRRAAPLGRVAKTSAGALTHDASFVLTNVVAEEATITSITVTNGDRFAVVEPSDPDADLVLASGDTADLVIRFDSDDATYATYSSTVTINFSDGKQTTFQVQGKHVDEPVIALVTSRSRVLVGTETPSVDLGTRTEIGLEDTWTFTLRIVRQSGNERALTISQITLQDDDEFYELVTPSSTPFVIEEDVDPYTVTVNFLGAASTGTYVLDATIVTDAFDGELDFELRELDPQRFRALRQHAAHFLIFSLRQV